MSQRRFKAILVDKKLCLTEIPRAQRWALARSLAAYVEAHPRGEAVAVAHLSEQHTMAAIAVPFHVHCTKAN